MTTLGIPTCPSATTLIPMGRHEARRRTLIARQCLGSNLAVDRHLPASGLHAAVFDQQAMTARVLARAA